MDAVRGRRVPVLAITLGVLVLAFALRVYRVGAEELWLDEAFSFRDVTAEGWLGGVRLRYVPPLYPILLRAWMALAGDGEAGLRLLSAVFGTLFVGATMWAARELFDARLVPWAGAVAALSPMGVYYSQELRAYTLLLLLLAATNACVWRAVRMDSWKAWVPVCLAATAALHTHYLAPLALVPTAIYPAVSGKPRQTRRWLAAMGTAGTLFLPWIVWDTFLHTNPSGRIDWIRDAWQATPPRLAIPKSLEVLYLGSEKGLLPITLKQFDTLVYPRSLRLSGLVTLSLLGLWVAAPSYNAALGIDRVGRRAFTLWVLLLFPLAGLWTLSWAKPVYVVGRYDQLALPALPLLIAFGLAKVRALGGDRGRVLAAVVALMLVVPPVGKLALFYREPARDRWQSRVTARQLDASVPSGALVLSTGLRGYPVGYQLRRLGYRIADGWCANPATGRRFSCRGYPREMGPAASPEDMGRLAADPTLIRSDLEHYLAAGGAAVPAIYVVFGSYGAVGDRLSVGRNDMGLVEELPKLGFTPATVDTRLGIVEFRPAVPRP